MLCAMQVGPESKMFVSIPLLTGAGDLGNGLFTPLRHSGEVTINADSLPATCDCSSFLCIPFCKSQRNCVYKSV